MHAYTHRRWRVAAIQWTGSNFADIERFAREHIGNPDEIGLRNEPDDEYNMVQFYAWNDDQEVDPEQWIVVHIGADQGRIMLDDTFRAAYEMTEAAADGR